MSLPHQNDTQGRRLRLDIVSTYFWYRYEIHFWLSAIVLIMEFFDFQKNYETPQIETRRCGQEWCAFSLLRWFFYVGLWSCIQLFYHYCYVNMISSHSLCHVGTFHLMSYNIAIHMKISYLVRNVGMWKRVLTFDKINNNSKYFNINWFLCCAVVKLYF